jgi:hypothetical protein
MVWILEEIFLTTLLRALLAKVFQQSAVLLVQGYLSYRKEVQRLPNLIFVILSRHFSLKRRSYSDDHLEVAFCLHLSTQSFEL